MGSRFVFHHPPVHCSWMNQVEQWFSILARRRLRIADFTDKAALAEVLRRVRATPGGRGRGVICWAPERIAVKGLDSPWGNRALFARDGKALTAIDAFAE